MDADLKGETFLQQGEWRDLYEKVAAGERISEEDALRLFESKDLNALGAIASLVCAAQERQPRQLHHQPLHQLFQLLHPELPVLRLRPQKARRRRHAIHRRGNRSKSARSPGVGITELHIVGGLHPSLPFSYYTDMLRALKGAGCAPAIEMLHRHRNFAPGWLAKKIRARHAAGELREAGLESLTGGGAEIFRKEIRSQIARGKESAEEYLDVHRTWHKMGGRSTCTMLYGHVESLADRVDHLRQLRNLQDETRGFTGFVPLPYQPENNDIPVKRSADRF
jgi:aminodeoxyfutalosine synthase